MFKSLTVFSQSPNGFNKKSNLVSSIDVVLSVVALVAEVVMLVVSKINKNLFS